VPEAPPKPSPAGPDHDDDAVVSFLRCLAMDAPFAAKSGHQGTAMALAPLAHALYSRVLRHDPDDPTWPDRDRFVLSNGHASVLQYGVLHASGYDVSLDDLKAFRSWGSPTPGHPEVGHTPGVEVTTGPLGQGFANAVGMAIAERRLRTEFGPELVDHHTWVIAGDGCFMEGISHEAASLAGHLGLGRLICVFDDNRITIDGSTDLTCSDDVPGRFASYGWRVVELDDIADDVDALAHALSAARDAADEDRPSLLVLRTRIGHPSPDLTGRHEAHGNPFTAEHISRTKALMGVPDEPFWRPSAVDRCAESARRRGREARAAWLERRRVHVLGDRFTAVWSGTPGQGWDRELPTYADDANPATRQAVQAAISATAGHLPALVVGSADLTGNTGAVLAGAERNSRSSPGGAQIHYGVREHAMGAIAVGMAHHGGVLPVIGTFFVFADYLRPAIRMASLSGARVVFIFSHDSVGVGEDGPTHQPVEHLASLRAMPGLHVIRPADARETVVAWRDAVLHDGPTALVLSRQAAPVVTDGSAVTTGAGLVKDIGGSPSVVLVGTGTEVAVCIAAGELLAADGIGVRIVSMPSWDRFAVRSEAERSAIFPPGLPVVSVEAAATFGWERWADVCVGIDRFGASAPGPLVLDRLGINTDAVVDAARTALARSDR
jgi:transketolase